MDVFDYRNIEPMLIANRSEPFNDRNWLFELKFDGIRCIAYLDGSSADLRNKRSMSLLHHFPELNEIYKQVGSRCILDGELVTFTKGTINFFSLQKRVLITDPFKIKQIVKDSPASYVVYDILYLNDRELIYLPQIERKELLAKTVRENTSLALSRFIPEYGIELYDLAIERKLEGVVAKKMDARYYYGKRSKDWIKFKYLKTSMHIICGYIVKPPLPTLILGQYDGDRIIYSGSVSFGVKLGFLKDNRCSTIPCAPFNSKEKVKIEGDTGNITWIEPRLVCEIEYMPSTKGGMRQPVFKGLRPEIHPEAVKRSIM